MKTARDGRVLTKKCLWLRAKVCEKHHPLSSERQFGLLADFSPMHSLTAIPKDRFSETQLRGANPLAGHVLQCQTRSEE